jgi:hypothetical protein
VSKRDLKTVAEELEELLAAAPRTEPSPPAIDESYFVAAEPIASPEQTAVEENAALLPELVRSIVEYAITRAPNSASASHIGEAIGEGVSAAVVKLSLDDIAVIEAVDTFLNELCESVRGALSME